MAANRPTRRPTKKALASDGLKRKAIKDSRSIYRTRSGLTPDAQVDLPRLVSEMAEISQRLLAVETQLSQLRAGQLPSTTDVAWLKAAEPAFAFWDNPEDAIYDTL
ncbi:MAG: hypothetical protein HY870_23875 [Chloroflexi bacterium]|nr:hypothetical protein [Chloroflexota bacterium]